MKTNQIISLFIFLCLIESCCFFNRITFQKKLISTGGRNEVIKNAILDFSNTSNLYKKDTVFSVKAGDMDENIIIVRIGKNNMKILLTDSIRVGGKGKLPSRYFETNEKLFFWWDDEYPLTDETLRAFQKYNLFQDDEGGIIKFPDFIIDDAQKAAHYYFCRNDFTKYKKVITNKGIGFYKPPKLKCK